jgi:RHS repeat-associated protein
MQALGGNPPGQAEGESDAPFLSVGVAIQPRPSHLSEAVPKGYLRMVFYDKQNQYLDEQTYYVESTFCQPLGVKPGTQQAQEVTVEQEGYVRVFVANESDVPVWFDDLEVSLEKGLLVQENHYDPWGLNLAGIEKQGNPDHKFQYNGKEKQDELKLRWVDYGWRNYDSQLGRWHTVDPMAEKYLSLSPYN